MLGTNIIDFNFVSDTNIAFPLSCLVLIANSGYNTDTSLIVDENLNSTNKWYIIVIAAGYVVIQDLHMSCIFPP